MAIQPFNNLETQGSVRSKINQNFAELDQARANLVTRMNQAEAKLGLLLLPTDSNKWSTPAALIAAHPSPAAGSYAPVESTDTFWQWDVDEEEWVDSGASTPPTDIENQSDYTPVDSDNATGFFAGLLTSGKLKFKAALDKIVATIKAKADKLIATTAISGSYEITVNDSGKVLKHTGTGTLTKNANFATGMSVSIIKQDSSTLTIGFTTESYGANAGTKLDATNPGVTLIQNASTVTRIGELSV